MTNRLNSLLEEAIWKKDIERVKFLLNEGADPNYYRNDDSMKTPIFLAYDPAIAEALLSHGARITAVNSYSETPLHVAITSHKSVELVKVLLRYGAPVNVTNRRGSTPLHLAMYRSSYDLKVVKELLENGSHINIRNYDKTRGGYVRKDTCLTLAMERIDCLKLMIKILLIKNFERDISNVINLSPYSDCRNYALAKKLMEECTEEIVQMKSEKINNVTLYDIVTKEPHKLTPFNEKLITEQILGKFPIYSDYISEKLVEHTKRRNHFKILKMLHMSITAEEKTITVIGDCLLKIGEYLTNEALLRFISVINYLPPDFSIEVRAEEPQSDIRPLKRRVEETDPNDSQGILDAIKRQKLEQPV